MSRKWNADKAVNRRPTESEHLGIGWQEALRRVVALNGEAQRQGVTTNVAEHLRWLAPCLCMCPHVEPPKATSAISKDGRYALPSHMAHLGTICN